MRFSVITINRNNAEGLERTIKSIIIQQRELYEFIIIDGASTDDSVNIIKKYQSYIRYYISEPDKGIYHAMNKGIAQAQGEYAIFINSGDEFSYANALYDVNNRSKLSTDFIFCGWIRAKSYTKKVYCLPAPKLTLYKMLYKSYCVCHQATFTKISVLKELQGYDEEMKISSDICFLMKSLVIHNKSYETLPFHITYFDITGISGSNAGTKIIKEEKPKYFKQTFPYIYDDYIRLHNILRFTPTNIIKFIKWKLSID